MTCSKRSDNKCRGDPPEDWGDVVYGCPNQQGPRCSSNGQMCKPENCAFFFLEKRLGPVPIKIEWVEP
jgi:hypothetical protein